MQPSRYFLFLSLLGIALFALNLLVGKLALMFGWNVWLHLEGVPEFLLLMITVVSFVIGTLLNEKARVDRDS